MNPPWSESRMREIRTSGLMSGIWKRNGLTATAPDLDSTKKASKAASYFCKVLLRNKLNFTKKRRFDDRL
jgi:hypothetical protein